MLDAVEAGSAELLEDALTVGSDLLDSWRLDKLTISGITRTVYSLVTSTQSYTIGSGGTFDQDYPTTIEAWSVIPDDDAAATALQEMPMGRPLTWDQWQQIRVKGQTGSYPTRMYFDRRWAAGLGNLLFHPIPNNGDVDIVLYQTVPAITTLVSATTYNLRTGVVRALKLGLAVDLGLGRFAREGGLPAGLEQRAAHAYGLLKRSNYIPRETPMRAEFSIGSGSGRRTYNVYQGSS